MGKAAELKTLPSMVQDEDGQERSLETLSLEALQTYQERMKENLKLQMDGYFTQHPDEWKRFLEG